ncbi:uncharacterized protein LOC143737764 isoform X2 [Siphateles boraxobius]|uniref:uncharacterized protein LOC143737764 isoform X2 n=1 Tax=Siphateles boraxobius TaxID=180520 RepID=UPI0040632825
MADEPQIESGEDRNPGEILDIRFQKNTNQKYKYLEAEPKILGVTQIALAVFLTSVSLVLAVQPADEVIWPVSGIITTMIIIIAGSLAIAAQNLHIPTLKACLGMQVVVCLACVIYVFMNFSVYDTLLYPCWPEKGSSPNPICKHLNIGLENYLALQKLVLTVHISLSATLAAYCCKVIQCCSPVSSVPVITVNRPPDPRYL